MDTTKAPNPKDTVTVTPVKSPVKHDGVLYKIGEAITAPWHELEDLVKAGIAKLETVVEDIIGPTTVNELKDWLTEHEVEIPQGANKAKLQELVKAKQEELAAGGEAK